MWWSAGNEGNTSGKTKTKSERNRDVVRQRLVGHVTWSHGKPKPEREREREKKERGFGRGCAIHLVQAEWKKDEGDRDEEEVESEGRVE